MVGYRNAWTTTPATEGFVYRLDPGHIATEFTRDIRLFSNPKATSVAVDAQNTVYVVGNVTRPLGSVSEGLGGIDFFIIRYDGATGIEQ